MTRSSKIIRREELDAWRSIDAIRATAQAEQEQHMADARAEREAFLNEAREKAFHDSMQSAMKIIVDTEAEAQKRMVALEPQVAALISATVAQIIGDLDHDVAIEHATKQALTRLKNHRRARIMTAPDTANAVRAAVAQVGMSGAEVIEVQVDERLEAGRTVLSSDQGHVEIGLADQIEAVTHSWTQPEAAS